MPRHTVSALPPLPGNVAPSWYFPPSGRRHLGLIVVPRCPGCGAGHFHRAVTAHAADGSTRVGSCGHVYFLRLTAVPDARRAA